MKITSYLVFFVSFIISIIFIKHLEKDEIKKSYKQLDDVGVILSETLYNKIYNSVSATTMNEILLENHNFDTSKFESWAPLILDQYKDLTNIQLAPNAVVKHIYPLQGNEKAIGHDLFKDKNRKIAALKAIETDKITFIGPIKLIQNNKYALIVRKPISYIDNGVKKFWGFSTALIDVENILSTLKNKLDKNIYNYAVYGNNPDLKELPIFISSKVLPSKNAHSFTIHVPNGEWVLKLDLKNAQFNTPPYYFIGFIISVLLGMLTHYYFKNIERERDKFKQIVDKSSDNIHIINKNGYISDSSETFAKTLGYSKEEILGKHISSWETQKNIDENYSINKLDKTKSFYTKYKKKNGSTIKVLVHLSKIQLDKETFINASIKDVSESIELEKIKTLQKNQSKLIKTLNDIQKLTNTAYWFYDVVDERFIVSLEFKNIFAIEKNEEVNFENILRYCHPQDLERVKDFIEYTHTNEVQKTFSYRLLINNEIKYIELTLKTNALNNKIVSTEGSVQDITKRVLKELEIEKQKNLMLQQQRLAQQGEMLEMISHQWKQPLSVLTLNSQITEFMLSEVENVPSDVFEKLKNNTEIVEFMSRTISDFKEFFTDEKIINEFTLEELIQESLAIIGHRIKLQSININKNFDDCINEKINGFKSELGQVILAIANNAIDILEEKTSERNLEFIVNKSENNTLILKIIDNAGGIPKDILPFIFDPYYSTKKDKNGTGLGLYMSKMIIEKSFKGSLKAYNTPNGACFEITIPKN